MNEISTQQRLLQTLHLLTNSARIHQDNNKVLIYAVNQFVALISRLCREDDEITLLFSEGSFYLHEEKIVFDRLTVNFGNMMLKYFADRKLEGLRFYNSISEASQAEITAFIRHLNNAERQEAPATWLEEQIEADNLTWVEHVRVSQVALGLDPDQKKKQDHSDRKQPGSGTGDGPDDNPDGAGSGGNGSVPAGRERAAKKKNSIQTYGYAVLSLQDISRKISNNRRPSIKKAMRLVQSMIDMVIDDNQMFISLSTIRDYDDYTYTHSINVAILSICLGHKIGLSNTALETLSLGALFHDLGKIDVPKEILNKPGRLDERELLIMRKHAIDSVRRIIKLKTTRKKKVPLLLPPFEHHLKYDLSGYPKTPRKKPLSLFGRIICIADVFDALTAPRIYRPSAWSPDRALGFMMEQSGKDFDPILLKVFINMIGIYPVGTLLKLDNDEMGLVARYADTENGRKELWVQLLEPEEDRKSFRKGKLINMGSWNAETASFNRSVLESLHPSVYGIQSAEYIM